MEFEDDDFLTGSLYVPPVRTGDDLLDDMLELMAYRKWIESKRTDVYARHMMSKCGIQLQTPPYTQDADYWYYDTF